MTTGSKRKSAVVELKGISRTMGIGSGTAPTGDWRDVEAPASVRAILQPRIGVSPENDAGRGGSLLEKDCPARFRCRSQAPPPDRVGQSVGAPVDRLGPSLGIRRATAHA